MPDTKTYTGLTAVTQALGPAAKKKPQVRWRRATLTSLAAVEELLDALEQSGCEEQWVTVAGDLFVVRWR